MPRRNSKRFAFTLIEMLVTISIIAILVAFLAPSLALARSSARTATCASNLKQLATLHFDQAWEENAFALSAYDLRNDRWPLVSSDLKATDNNTLDKPIDPPDRVSNFGQKLHKAESTAPEQPLHWNLPCPEARPRNQMSFGLNFTLRNIDPDRIRPRDVVFACSPYRLLVRGRDLLPTRHHDNVNFLYGDLHIAANLISALPEIDAYRKTWRADPIPAKYPEE